MAGSPQWITVDPDYPDPDAIKRAAALIQGGGLVIFPTKGLYGLAADAGNKDAVERVFQAKQRPETKALLVLVNHRSDLSLLTPSIPENASRLMDRFWPGDVTIVLDAFPELSPYLTAGTGRIGVRMPQHPVAKALVAAAGIPITGTSANMSGRPGCSHPRDLDTDLVCSTDLVLDAGPLIGGPGSTVVDATVTPITILRQGRIPADDIRSALT